MTVILELDGVKCVHPNGQSVVENIHLRLRRGEPVSLLGPSGCGKTTVLRAIAGFMPVTAGEIRLNSRVVSRPGFTLPPESRGIGMVFQDYALFPHLTVGENVAFGLHRRPKAERESTVDRLLDLVGLHAFKRRYPHELSGGQQQRVALARALAPHPDLILLDEPFSNLDVALRERLVFEVREILGREGITGVLVTHDQQEAFAWGEKIGVLHQGFLQQWGTPGDLHHEPVNRFVANFVGQGVMLRGTMAAHDTVVTPAGTITGNRAYTWPPGTEVEVLLRPDDVLPDEDSPLRAIVTRRLFEGAEILYHLTLPSGEPLLAVFPSSLDYPPGAQLGIRVVPAHLVMFTLPASVGLPDDARQGHDGTGRC